MRMNSPRSLCSKPARMRSSSAGSSVTTYSRLSRVAIARADRPRQPVADVFGQQDRVLGPRRRSRRAFPGSGPTGGSAPARAAASAGSAALRPASSRRGSAHRPRPARSSSVRRSGASSASRVRISSACLRTGLGQVRGDARCPARPPCSRTSRPGRASPGSIHTAGVPKAGSLRGDAVDLAGRHAASRSPATCSG